MRVGMIGLGDIAAKAWLPVLAAVPGIELHLATRDPARLAALGDAWRIPHRHASLDPLLAARPDAVLVHAATAAHPALVARLLDAGIPTLVDKPLADSLAEAERLVALARARGVSLMVGFNRRFAPALAALRDAPRDLILLQKNRATLPAPPRVTVFDDFIHVADTLRFLVPGPVARTTIELRREGADLAHVHLTLAGTGPAGAFAATGTMSRMSGSDEEWVEAIGGGGKRRVESLRETIVHQAGRIVRLPAPDWRPATWVRGFEAMAAHFLAAVAAGTLLDAGDALETHRLCEAIVARAEAAA
ncbi:Gfo/Idh/MocA family oxidoreductase [Sphingomonas parva]|uniref:Gfo/Idh/MocA family oxidoreductase n=1 Tax=Sphingomonas parva TaxID=2555898 RepID=A0A4Y8ZPP2_9SPHN|nr:Gfo/Idh/MocA family oxidoreductase [Sphingomonas parva]TFI56436.1 Gfo/Idh/MocA family oxidoreductase [Sphingomonas parva]